MSAYLLYGLLRIIWLAGSSPSQGKDVMQTFAKSSPLYFVLGNTSDYFF